MKDFVVRQRISKKTAEKLGVRKNKNYIVIDCVTADSWEEASNEVYQRKELKGLEIEVWPLNQVWGNQILEALKIKELKKEKNGESQ